MPAQLLKTVKPSGGDYTSLEACMNANEQDLTAADKYFDVEIDGTWSSADTTKPTIHNYTVDATRYINIYTTSTARHQGIYSTSYYRWQVGTSNDRHEGWLVNNSCRITGIQFQRLSGDYGSALIDNNSTFGADDSIIKSCIFYQDTTARNYGGVEHAGDQNPIYLINNIFINCVYGVGGGAYSGGALFYLYNNTAYGCTTGFGNFHYATVYAKNNIAYNNTTDYATDTDAFHSTSTNNLSKDTTAPAKNTYYVSKTLTFVNAAGNDLHLASTDTDAIDHGADLSGTFTDDIDGVTRTGTWDIGADEYVAAGGAGINPFVFYYAPLSWLLNKRRNYYSAHPAGGRRLFASLSESLGLTDTQQLATGSNWSETLTTADDPIRNFGINPSETLTPTDSSQRGFGIFKSETLTIAEVLTDIWGRVYTLGAWKRKRISPFMKPPLGVQLDKGHQLSKGLVALWLGNEGGGNTVRDIINNNHATMTSGGAATTNWIATSMGVCPHLKTTLNDYYIAPSKKPIKLLQAYTLNAWFYRHGDAGVSSHIFSKKQQYALYMADTGGVKGISFDSWSSGGVDTLTSDNGVFADFRWNMATATIRRGYKAIYVNGKHVKSNNLSVVQDNNDENLWFGETDGGGAGDGFSGKFGYHSIYNRALESQEVRMLYEQPFCFMRPTKLFAYGMRPIAGSAKAWTEDLLDTVSLTDTTTRAFGKALSETITLTELLGRGIAKALSENLNLVDICFAYHPILIELSEAITLHEVMVSWLKKMGVSTTWTQATGSSPWTRNTEGSDTWSQWTDPS